MATADDALNVARAQLGKGPDEFCAWYPAPIGTAWCCIFQSWVLSQVGIPTHYAWVSGLFDFYRANGRTFAPREAQPGDLVAFDYDGGGPRAYDHIAMVEYVERDAAGTPTALIAINGNWTNKVCRVRHAFGASGFAGGIAEIARPAYSTPAPPPPSVSSTIFPFDEEPMRRFIRPQSSPNVYLTDAGCLGKVHVASEDRLKDFAYALRVSNVPLLDPPAEGKTDVIAGQKVWVVGDEFAANIPTIG